LQSLYKVYFNYLQAPFSFLYLILVRCWVVPKRCVPERIFWDPWSPKGIVPETQWPCFDTSMSFCITYMYCIMQVLTGLYHSRDIVCCRTINLGTRGPRNSYGVTSFRDLPSPHPIFLSKLRSHNLLFSLF